jgi:hypothetical protein
MKGNYSDAKYHFQKALSFDSYNQFTLEYLYYSYLNTGKDEAAAFIERKLNPELRKILLIKSFKLIESFDLEYNYKFAGTISRSNPQYFRLGINSKLGYRLSLYQSLSTYRQAIDDKVYGTNRSLYYKQPAYYILLKYAITSKVLFKAAYHQIKTISDTSVNNGNFGLIAVSKDINRVSLEAYGSLLTFGQTYTKQAGIQSAYCFPGRSNVTLTGTLSGLFQENSNRLIYNQKFGLKVFKKVWTESNITLGKLTYYNDYNGLYVYNTYDPITFKGGATMLIFLSRNITLWANYSIERKEYYENSSFHYNQFSYLGGIKWKL